jgi:hypothetical protein
MKIGVFGDSFCTLLKSKSNGLPDASWVSVMIDRGFDITSHGRPGTSSWWSYEQFLKHYHEYTHIIFMYSHFCRISTTSTEFISELAWFPSVEILENSPRFKDLPDNIKHEVTVLTEANSIMWENEYALHMQRFIQHQVFDQVNTMCAQSNKKLINVDIFDDLNISNKNHAGSYLCKLNDISVRETINSGITTEDSHYSDVRSCHLSDHNNRVLADIMIETINQDCDNKIVQDLFTNPGFAYD